MWDGEKVADLVQLNSEVVDDRADHRRQGAGPRRIVRSPAPRDFVADQILRETLLTVSSDWPFMVSKDSAADYARYRAHLHAHAAREIAAALAAGRREQRTRLAADWNRADGLFGAPRRAAGMRRAHRGRMKILMVSWEYPPVVIGGLGRHVHHLATELAGAGHEVVVLCRRPTGTDPHHPPDHRRGRTRASG